MFYLHHNLDIAQNFYIYHINTNEILLKRLFKRLNMERKNILCFNFQNRTNIDIFIWSKTRITKDDQDVSNYILFKENYQDYNVLLLTFFPSSEFCRKFKEEKKFNSSIYVQFHEKTGAYFVSKSNKKKCFYFCDKNNNHKLQNIDFQLEMFNYTKEKEQIIDKITEQNVINSNKIDYLFT